MLWSTNQVGLFHPHLDVSGFFHAQHQFTCILSFQQIFFEQDHHYVSDFKDDYIASEAWLELVCECYQGTVSDSDSTDFKIREKLKMIRVKPSETKILFDSKTQKTTPSVEVKANEMTEHNPEKGRMRLFLRLKHVSASDEATYKCVISGRNDENSGIKTKQLSYNFTLPPPQSTPPTLTTTWKTPPSTPQPAQTTIAITTTISPGLITGNPEESSKTNVYILVAILSFLLIVIVIVIICFVRVRVRRQREKAARTESLDFDFGQTHTANHNLVFKPSINDNANHCHGNHSADACTHNTCDNCHSPACNGAAQGQGHRQDNGGGRNARGVDSVPLLPVHTCPTHARTGRQSAGSEEHRRQRFLFDTPRRPRPRDNSHFAATPAHAVAPPPASRSCYALDSMDLVTDSEDSMYQYRNSRRLSFPRFHYGEEEDFTVLPSHYHGNAAYGHPRRSLSQQSLHRHSRHHRRPYPTQAPPLDVTYAPSTNPRQPHNGYLPRDYAGAPYQTTPLVSPNGQRPRMRSEEGGEAPPFPTGSKERRQPSLAVRVREDNNVAYSDTFFGESSAREDAVHQANEPVYNGGGGVVLPEPVPRVYRELQPPAQSRRGTTTPDVAMASEDEMTRHRVSPYGTAAGNMIVDPRHPQDRSGYPVQSLPSRRRRHNTSPPPRQYHTSSVPRKRSGDRHAGRSIHHNRSHPQLFYLSDAENGGLITYHLPGDSSHPQQYIVQQPPKQRSGRSFSQSAADGFDYDSRHRGVSSNRRGSELESDGQGQGHPANQDRYSHSYLRAAERQNLLSRENVSPSRGPATTNLNVPLTGRVDVIAGSGSRGEEASGRQKDPAVDRPSGSGRRGDRQRRRERSNDEQDDPHATRRKATPATTSDTSPDLARQRSAHPRRHSVSSSDSDNFHTPTPNTPTTTTAPITIASTSGEPRPPHHREPHDEINLRDIKTDNETRPKRPVSSRINTATATATNNGDNLPVACAADVAVRDPGLGGPSPSRCAGRLQKKESVSRSRGGSRRSEASGGGPEGRGVGPEGWAHLGVDIMTSADNSLSGQCSQYTTTNHSTTVKTPHPRVE
ncbi:serine/arginine repetitive matrix protein 1-like isoform X3 [Littorina saxatilis]|uniref:serine/arginine repetitive matrix protein 1-like isoform X3 n=1 Tax=Littorina saxatilis TaxID=31220 RepID=UPI0038B4DDDB